MCEDPYELSYGRSREGIVGALPDWLTGGCITGEPLLLGRDALDR